MGAMRAIEFARECVARAFKHSLGIVDGIIAFATVIAGFVGWLMGAEIVVNAPWWLILLALIGSVFAMRLICAPYWIYKEAADDRDRLKTELDERTRRRQALNDLADQLVYASATLFRWPVATNADIPALDAALDAWRTRVRNIISKNFSDAEAVAVDRVTSVSAADFGGKTPVHNNRLMFTNERINRIRAFIEKRS